MKDRLWAYITAKERSTSTVLPPTKRSHMYVKQMNHFRSTGANYKETHQQRGRYENKSVIDRPRTSALVSKNTNDTKQRYCRYYANRHLSDECTKYKTIAERKRILMDLCYKCLRDGHKNANKAKYVFTAANKIATTEISVLKRSLSEDKMKVCICQKKSPMRH